jgi:hypothetical protein
MGMTLSIEFIDGPRNAFTFEEADSGRFKRLDFTPK